jgi:type VI secretion system protein ImpL
MHFPAFPALALVLASMAVATPAHCEDAAAIDAAWQADVLPACLAATQLYPFNRSSAKDLGLRDFQSLLGAGGLIDNFFQEHLSTLVDTSAQPWTFLKPEDSDPGMPDAVLVAFERAAAIRDSFFAEGGRPAMHFQVTPFAVDATAYSAVLEIDGHSIVYTQRDGAPTPSAQRWPGSVGVGRVSLSPERRDEDNTVKFEGDFAFFRLLDTAEIRDTAQPGEKRAVFQIGSRVVIYALVFAGPSDFPPGLLQSFACPTTLQ